jgi:hypothetical protein
MPVLPKSIRRIHQCSSPAALRKNQYKDIRDVMISQGYIAGCATAGACVVYGYGSEGLRRVVADTVVSMTPFASAVVVGRALTLTWKVGRLYQVCSIL